MYPLLISIGPIQIYNLSVFLILSWLVFSFVFWRSLKDNGVEDERIFDLTFYTTIVAFVFARLFFVIFHWPDFSDDLLKIPAIWVVPGLSYYGGLFSGIMTMILLGVRYKIRIGYIVDALAFALLFSYITGSIGSLLDGTVIGKHVNAPWAVNYIGHAGLRHPVQLFYIISMIIIFVPLVFITKKVKNKSLPCGTVGIWYCFFFSVSQFIVEFFKESSVYWFRLSLYQWICIGLFGEAIGAWYVRGGGRDKINPILSQSRNKFSFAVKNTYEWISQRFTGRHPDSS